MKPLGLLLAASLIANVALVVSLLSRPGRVAPEPRDSSGSDVERTAVPASVRPSERTRDSTVAQAGTKRAAATEPLLWSRLDSADLPTLVARLRAAGFPAGTIRNIVSARIEASFRPRIAALALGSLTAPFWKPDPTGIGDVSRLLESLSEISRERSQLARQLFSDEFFTQDQGTVSESQRARYGDLPRAKIDIVERINHDYAEMEQQIRAAARGILLPEDREKLAFLQEERRKDLATVLSPAELEDHLMRTSPITNHLRTALAAMDATEAEFRAIYQIYLPHADVLFPGFGGSGMMTIEMALKRRGLQDTLSTQIQAALGEARAQDFARAGNGEYQRLARLVQVENLPAETAVRAFDLRDRAARESMRIYNDGTITTEQKRAALQDLAQATSNQLLTTLGSRAGQVYVKSATWLPMIASGEAITFSPEGGWSSRPVSPAPVTPPPGRP